MVEHVNLLPRNATALEKALAIVNDPLVALQAEFAGIALADRNPPPALLPFLVWEYGLGELTPYLPNLYDVISDGVRWQRIRGTPAAVSKGLGWLGYSGTIEEDPTRRRYWSGFQVHLDRVRDADTPDLDRIEGVTSLSVPVRSRFYRGFYAYDIRASETGTHRLGRSMIATHSGARIRADGAKWSFGRSYSADTTLGEADLDPLGVWIEPVADSDLWSTATYPWSTATLAWDVPLVISRRRTIAADLCAMRAWVRFADADGDVIGYARAVVHPVRDAFGGEYQIGAASWMVDADRPAGVLVMARTPFGGGAGQVASSMSVLFDAVPASGVKPGSMWLGPDDLVGGHVVALTSVAIPLGLTVRENTRFILRL